MNVLEKIESFVRTVLTCMKTGSWSLSKDIETERLLFPKAYNLGKERNKWKF